jgi:hypothetical protein
MCHHQTCLFVWRQMVKSLMNFDAAAVIPLCPCMTRKKQVMKESES